MPLINKDIKDSALRIFSSLKLAVVLLIVLALFSIGGTVVPQEQGPAVYIQRYGESTYGYLKLLGLVDLYHSWGFRFLMGLLSINLVVCSVRRLKGIYRRTVKPVVEKDPDAIKRLRVSNILPSPSRVEMLERVLEEKNYKLVKRGHFLYGTKGRLGPWGDMVTHLSIAVIMLGALVGSLGFVGTVNVYEGGWTGEFYNWNSGRDEPLGFAFVVDKLTLQYYPVELKIGVKKNPGGDVVGVFPTREGSSFVIPGTGFRVETSRMDFGTWEAELNIYEDDRLLGRYRTGQPGGGMHSPVAFGYEFGVAAFKDPVLKSVASSVRLIRDDVTVKRGIIEINNPLRFEGMSIYQTAFDRDQGGAYFSGFQVVRDPGIPLVWAGFALILVGLFFSFYFYHRQIWVYAGKENIVIGGTTNKDWGGFMREYGGVIKSFMQEVEPL